MNDKNERRWISPEGIKNDPKFDLPNIPKYSSYEEYVMDFAQTALLAIMATILYAAENGTPAQCVLEARDLYKETKRQIQESRK